MSNVNVLIAVTDATWALLKQNFQWIDPEDRSLGRVREDLTLAQAKKMRNNRAGTWKAVSAAGNDYTILSLDIPAEFTVAEGDPKLVWIEFLLDTWPGKFIVLRAWKKQDRNLSPPYGVEIR